MEDMNNNEALRKAKEELNKISADEREELAFQRLMCYYSQLYYYINSCLWG